MDGPAASGYWHLWCDSDGSSRLDRGAFGDLRLAAVAEGAVPILEQSVGSADPASIDLAVVRSGVIGEWHETPRPLWGVVLSGRFFLEVMDGTRVELVAGDLFLGMDQGTHAAHGRRGHRSGAVGDDDVTLLMIPVQAGTTPVTREGQPKGPA